MKSIVSLLVVATLLSTVTLKAQEKFNWKEMDEFHTVLSATFHPSQGGDLAPLKSRSSELADKAIAWQKSKVPGGLNKKEIKSSLKKLTSASKELHRLVKNNTSDEMLKQKLSSLHDIFHAIKDKYDKKGDM